MLICAGCKKSISGEHFEVIKKRFSTEKSGRIISKEIFCPTCFDHRN